MLTMYAKAKYDNVPAHTLTIDSANCDADSIVPLKTIAPTL